MELTDKSKKPHGLQYVSMPFGKYTGFLMENVPANYLYWLWDELGSKERSPYLKTLLVHLMVKTSRSDYNYIIENLDDIQQEIKYE